MTLKEALKLVLDLAIENGLKDEDFIGDDLQARYDRHQEAEYDRQQDAKYDRQQEAFQIVGDLQMTQFTFHTDPGHGWLEVTDAQIEAAGLSRADFSEYSYRIPKDFEGGGLCFLEEDCDAPKFLAAWEKIGQTVEIREANSNRNSFIRSLRRIRE